LRQLIANEYRCGVARPQAEIDHSFRDRDRAGFGSGDAIVLLDVYDADDEQHAVVGLTARRSETAQQRSSEQRRGLLEPSHWDFEQRREKCGTHSSLEV
jgi:hypothetical protein